MIKKEVRTKSYEVIIHHCDFCNFEIENQKSITGISPVMKCIICEKDCCSDHREMYKTGSDQTYSGVTYPDLDPVCLDCNKDFKEAYSLACCEDIEYDYNEEYGESIILGETLTKRALKYIDRKFKK